MRIPSILCGAAAGAIVLGFAFGGSAMAAPPAPPTAGDSTASLQISQGFLQISTPSTNANLGTQPNSIGGESFVGHLGTVTVDDARSGTTGWNTTVTSGGFTAAGLTTIPASAIGYDAGTVGTTGTSILTLLTQPSHIDGATPPMVVEVNGVNGDNTANWNPTVTVAVPGSSAAASYSATFTHSVQ